MANSDRSSGKHPYRAPKAYRNQKFLDSPDARSLRILSEYLEPMERFEHYGIQDTILFFGSARILSLQQAQGALKAAKRKKEGVKRAETALDMAKYYEATRQLARRLTAWSKGLKGSGPRFVVCSGGGPGIMEAANRGASEAKGENIGLGISLPFEQSGNEYITHKLAFEFHYFFMRKFWFLYMAKAMVIMPGGFGTMDELFESLTLMQTAKMKKHMPIVLFGAEFWDAVMDLGAMARFGTIAEDDLDRLYRTDSVDDAFDYITGELAGEPLEKPGGFL